MKNMKNTNTANEFTVSEVVAGSFRVEFKYCEKKSVRRVSYTDCLTVEAASSEEAISLVTARRAHLDGFTVLSSAPYTKRRPMTRDEIAAAGAAQLAAIKAARA